MIVRDLQWHDFDDLTEAYYLLYEERAAGAPIGMTLFDERPNRSDEVDWFSSIYRRVLTGDAIARVAEADGRVVGNCIVQRVGRTPTAENGHVGSLGLLVHRDHRGEGIGTALLSAALDASQGTFEIVRLSVFATNDRARKLYERFGFRLVGRFPQEIKRGGTYVDEDLMVLLLKDRAPSPPYR